MTRPAIPYILTEEKKKLAEDNYPFLLFRLKHYLSNQYISSCDFEEIKGLFHLYYCKGVDNYVPHPKFKFTTFIDWYFRSAFQRYCRLRNRFYDLNIKFLENLPYAKTTVALDSLKLLFQEADLTDKEINILMLKFVGKQSLNEVGLKYNRSGEAIRLIILKSIKKVQQKIEEEGYKYDDFTQVL